MKPFFYKPEDAYAIDFIPFYKDGFFQLFYLKDWRDIEKYGDGTAWYLIRTNDFVNYEELGEAISRGTIEEQDFCVFTGCVFEAEGVYHIFYTGHNFYFPKHGKAQQAVMHAISSDLIKWEKVPEDTFFAPEDKYEPHDWRDPFVFWNEEAGEFWMLLAARLKEGPSRRRGCTALCTSKDLKHWEVREPFWAPGLYYTHECPDLFRMGEWWYLIYSTFSERFVTHYRMSKSLKGPWVAPENDTFDNRAFYAAKTCSDGKHRYAFGWNPTREHGKDEGKWINGGNLVVHEIVQDVDGRLYVKVPDMVEQAFTKELPVHFSSGTGQWTIDADYLSVDAPDSFACAVDQEIPACCKISAKVTFAANTRGCGVMLRSSDDLEQAYYIRLEPGRKRLVLDSWPRQSDMPYMVELERPIECTYGETCELKIFVDNTICVIYLDDHYAMSTRLYNLPKEGKWGVFVNEGSARFDNLKLSEYNYKNIDAGGTR